VQANNVRYRQHGKAYLFSGDSAKNTRAADTSRIHARKHKLIAALLALPIPLGVFGAHRIYLGSSAGVPIAYIATFGGAFGILPFIDCVLIVINKDINAYAYNPRIFMWTRPEKKKK
jgi:TM2 domain-containing membrane protein YozV